MEKKPTQILKVGGGSPVISREGEVKKALLAGILEVPYRLDSGADVSVMSEELLEELRAGAVVRTRKCVRPHVVELRDGSHKSITHMALVNISLATNHGPIRLENVQLLVLPGSSRELLVGKPELTRLQLPNLEEALEALAAVRHGRNMPEAGKTQASDSVTLLHAVQRMSEDDIAGHHKDIIKAVKKLDTAAEDTTDGEVQNDGGENEDSDDDAPLIRSNAPRDEDAITRAIEEMLERAATAGAPAEFI